MMKMNSHFHIEAATLPCSGRVLSSFSRLSNRQRWIKALDMCSAEAAGLKRGGAIDGTTDVRSTERGESPQKTQTLSLEMKAVTATNNTCNLRDRSIAVKNLKIHRYLCTKRKRN